MRLLSCTLLLLLVTSGGFAQQKNEFKKPSTLAIHFGSHDFLTPQLIRSSSLSNVLSGKKWAKFANQSPALGVSYLKGISNHFDVSANYFLSSLDYPFRDATARYGTDYLHHEGDVSLHMKLLTDNYFLVPYLSAGIGGSAYKGNRFDAFIPLGAGLQFNLAPNTMAFSNIQYRVPVTERAQYHFLYTLGVGFGLSGKKKAAVVAPPPPPPPPAPVVVDTDGDGIPDKDDKCPTVKGLAKYQGCPIPDSDGDGINDEEDKCPKVAGLARYKGCPIPDTDGDGVNDEEDKCPTVAGLARYQGCPIPDTDGDGINDEEDKCPNLAGVASNLGCPAMQFNPEKITFNTGSAVLTPGGVTELRTKVLPMLKQFGDAKVQVQGHTDNTGVPAKNMVLSQRRAETVKAWLVKNGIAADRLSTQGFGQTVPVADNKTAVGRAKNRRVEFKLVD